MAKHRQKSKSYKPLGKDKESDSDGEETKLFVRKKSPKIETPFVEKNIEEGDTLQSLAIRYHCTVEDLKRLNNIHKDNEIYARRAIKVPHRPFSEALATTHDSGASSPHSELIDLSESSTSKLVDIDEVENKLQNVTLSSPFRSNSSNNSSKVNEIIFNSSIHKSQPERLEVFHDDPDAADEVVQLIPQRDDIFEPDAIVTTASIISCSGSDWDISWPLLLVCIVVVIVAVPVIWVVYIAEHPEKYEHHNMAHEIVNGSHNTS